MPVLTTNDFSLLVLDRNNKMLCAVPYRDVISMTAEDMFNAQGNWSLSLIPSSVAVNALRSPGATLSFQGPGFLQWAGPVTKWTKSSTAQDGWRVDFEGVTDHIRLKRAIHYSPSEGLNSTVYKTYQNLLKWAVANIDTPSRRNVPSFVVHDELDQCFVGWENPMLGTAAMQAARTKTVGVNFPWGNKDMRLTMHDYLLPLLTKLNLQLVLSRVPDGRVGLHLRPVGDLTDKVILDSNTGSIVGSRFGVESPSLSGVYFFPTEDSVTATGALEYTNWNYGLLEEVILSKNSPTVARSVDFINQEIRNTDAFHPKGFGQFELSSNLAGFGTSWGVGDMISVRDSSTADDPYVFSARVSSAVYSMENSGIRVGLRLGDDVVDRSSNKQLNLSTVSPIPYYENYKAPNTVSVQMTSGNSRSVSGAFDLASNTSANVLEVWFAKNLFPAGTTHVTFDSSIVANDVILLNGGVPGQTGRLNGLIEGPSRSSLPTGISINSDSPITSATTVASLSAGTAHSFDGNGNVSVKGWLTGAAGGVSSVGLATLNVSNVTPSRANGIVRGQTITFGQQSVSSPDGQLTLHGGTYNLSAGGYYMRYEANNLSGYYGRVAMWFPTTEATTHLTLQTDGNLVLYRGSTAVWQSGTSTAVYGDFQNDGNFVLKDAAGNLVWQSYSGRMSEPSTLRGGGSILNFSGAWNALISSNKRYSCFVYGGGFVVHDGSKSSQKYIVSNSEGHRLSMNMDGNLVLYKKDDSVAWSAGISGAGNRLVMQDDGNLVVYSSTGAVKWVFNGA